MSHARVLHVVEGLYQPGILLFEYLHVFVFLGQGGDATQIRYATATAKISVSITNTSLANINIQVLLAGRVVRVNGISGKSTGFVPSLCKTETNKRQMKRGEGRIRGWRHSVGGANIGVVHVEIRRVAGRRNFRNVRGGAVSQSIPIDSVEPRMFLKFKTNVRETRHRRVRAVTQ